MEKAYGKGVWKELGICSMFLSIRLFLTYFKYLLMIHPAMYHLGKVLQRI